jgi:hypothetical protein
LTKKAPNIPHNAVYDVGSTKENKVEPVRPENIWMIKTHTQLSSDAKAKENGDRIWTVGRECTNNSKKKKVKSLEVLRTANLS